MADLRMMERAEQNPGPTAAAPTTKGRPVAQSIIFLLFMTLLLGGAYPLVVTGITQLAFPHQANGSLLFHGKKMIGSALIGQYFHEPGYFWGRPSATSPNPYDPALSSASNLTPAGSVLENQIKARVAALRAANVAEGLPPGNGRVPADLVTASGSGLDPDISPAAAYFQVDRIAKARGLTSSVVLRLVADHIQVRFLGILGEPRVNVLELNLALDKITGHVGP